MGWAITDEEVLFTVTQINFRYVIAGSNRLSDSGHLVVECAEKTRDL